MNAKSTRKVLIPAAGFGKRVGAPAAKELFIDERSGAPLIEFSLGVAAQCVAEPLVITRTEKRELIEYCMRRGVDVLEIAASKEWPDTLLQAEALWGDRNLVLLPDTRFTPADAAGEVFELLNANSAAFGLCALRDYAEWGVVARREQEFLIAEKPKSLPTGDWDLGVWGIFAFRATAGTGLLKALLNSATLGTWERLEPEIGIANLAAFEDMTRPVSSAR